MAAQAEAGVGVLFICGFCDGSCKYAHGLRQNGKLQKKTAQLGGFEFNFLLSTFSQLPNRIWILYDNNKDQANKAKKKTVQTLFHVLKILCSVIGVHKGNGRFPYRL
ncbi:MAG: hypothetical protein M5U34_30510 [Chloroflexi bacterium]|nr:hypothetical protein [Chloroflexota bacterium]